MATFKIFGVPNKEPRWAFCGQDGYVGYSSDSVTWTANQAIAGSSNDLKEITYGGPAGEDKWVAAYSGGNDDVIYSYDVTSVAWSSENPANAGGGKRVKWDGAKWVIGTSEWGPAIYLTDDMSQVWTSVNDNIWGALNNLTYNGSNLWIAVGQDGKMASSVDATSWSVVADSSFGTNNISDVHYANGMWVAVGEYGKIATSTDGAVWTQRDNPINDPTPVNVGLESVAYGDGVWVAVGGQGIALSSADGINWVVRRAQGSGAGNNDVTFGNGIFIAGGYNGTLLKSADSGVTWSVLSPANGGRNIYGVCYRGDN